MKTFWKTDFSNRKPSIESRLTNEIAVLLLLFVATSSFAGSAKWRSNPASGDWNTAVNWQPATVPNGAADIARFAGSATTNISISADTEANSLRFLTGGSMFTVTAPPAFSLTISGLGITNSSGVTQNFVTAVDATGSHGIISFTGSSTAGNRTAFTTEGQLLGAFDEGELQFFDTASAGGGAVTNNGPPASGIFGGRTRFFGSSTAGNATFVNQGSAIAGFFGGATFFFETSNGGAASFTNNAALLSNTSPSFTDFTDNSSAGTATVTNKGATVTADGGFALFFGSASAAGATISNEGGTGAGFGGGTTNFNDTSSAGNSTLIANPGVSGGLPGDVFFYGDSTGGTARLELLGDGNLDISVHNLPGVTIGSLEGQGVAKLGANNLTVGASNLNTTFSGTIQDGGQNGGTNASLTKIGTGTLTLSGINTYTGGTTVNQGVLLIRKATGSGTGSGAVQVNSGTLGGNGVITGAVTIGTTPDMGAILAPGLGALGTLTIQSSLSFVNASTFEFQLNSSIGKADKVIAQGVSLAGFSGLALFSFVDLGNGTLAAGTVFTAINNTAATPFTGTFANLADNSTFTVGNNTYKVSYEGGSGNDLTLTVQ